MSPADEAGSLLSRAPKPTTEMTCEEWEFESEVEVEVTVWEGAEGERGCDRVEEKGPIE